MWKITKIPTTNLFIQLTLTFVFTILLWDTALGLSDKRLCADEQCKEIISLGKGKINYRAGEEGMVSFKINSAIRIKSKSAGADQSLWGIEVNGREGFAPKSFIREEKILIGEKNLKFVVDVVKPGSKAPTVEPHVLNSSEVTVDTTTTQPLDAVAMNSEEEAIISSPVETASVVPPEMATPVQQETIVDGTRIPTLNNTGDTLNTVDEDIERKASTTSGMEEDTDDDEGGNDDDDEIGDYDDDEDDGSSEDMVPTNTINMEPSPLSANTDNNSISSQESSEPITNDAVANENVNITENLKQEATNDSSVPVEATTILSAGKTITSDEPIPPSQELNEAIELTQPTEEIEPVTEPNPVSSEPSAGFQTPESSPVVGVNVDQSSEKLSTVEDTQQQEVPTDENKESSSEVTNVNTTNEASATANEGEHSIENNISNYPSLPENSTNDDTTTEKPLPIDGTETIQDSEEITVSENTQQVEINKVQTGSPSPTTSIELPTDNTPSHAQETENTQSNTEPPIFQHSAPTQTENIKTDPESTHSQQTDAQSELHVTDNPHLKLEARTPSPQVDQYPQKTNENLASMPYNPYDYVESSNTPLPPQYDYNNPTELPQTDIPHYDYYGQLPTGYTPSEYEAEVTTVQPHISPSEMSSDGEPEMTTANPQLIPSDREAEMTTANPQLIPSDREAEMTTANPQLIPSDREPEMTTANPQLIPSDPYYNQDSYGKGIVEPLQPLVTPETPKTEEEPKTLPSLTPPFSSEEVDKKENKGLFATIMDTVNNILPNNKKSKHAGHDPSDNELNRILYPDVDGGHKMSTSKEEEDKMFCEKVGPNDCPHLNNNQKHSQDECVCSLKSLITTEFTIDTFAQALAAKILEISDLIAFLAIVAAATLFFTFGYYCFCNSSSEGALLSKLNQLESSLLATHKENAILKHNLMSTRQKLVSIEDNSFGSNDMVVSIKKELEEELVEKARLQEQITALQKELENAADAGIELNKIVSELLSNQTGDESIISSVEELQKQLNEQQNTILEINASLAEKSRENSELQLLIAEQNARYESEISNLQRDNDELEAEKGNLQSRLEEIKTDFDKDITAALEGKNFEIKRLQNEIVDLSNKVEAEHTKWQTSMAKVEALEECLKNIKRDPNVNITQVIDVANIRAELLDAQRKYTALKERLELELDARKLSENQLHIVTAEVEKLKQDFNQSEKDKLEAQTRLEVLSNYFKDKENQLQKELSLKETMWLKQQGETTTTVDRLTTMQEEIQSLKSQNDALRAEIEAQVAAHKAQTGTLENRAHETWLAARQSDRRYEEARAEATALRRKLTALAGGNVIEVNKPSAGPAGLGDDLTNAPSPIHMESPGSPMLGRMPPPPFLPPPFMGPPPPFMGMPPPPPFVPPGEMRPAPLGRIMSPPPPQRSGLLDYEDYMDYEGNNSWHRHHTYSPPPRTYRSLSPTDSRYDYGTERDLISTYDTETDFSPPPSPRESRGRGRGGGGGGGGAYDSDKGGSNSRNPYNNSKKSSSGNKGNISSGSDKSYNSSSKHGGSKSKSSGGGKSLV